MENILVSALLSDNEKSLFTGDCKFSQVFPADDATYSDCSVTVTNKNIFLSLKSNEHLYCFPMVKFTHWDISYGVNAPYAVRTGSSNTRFPYTFYAYSNSSYTNNYPLIFSFTTPEQITSFAKAFNTSLSGK